MPKLKMTARTLGTIRPPEKGQIDYWDEGTPGFGLRVSAGGRMAWQVMYRNDGGVKKRHTFNTYPSLGLGDAREQAKDFLRDVAKGSDPAADKQARLRADTVNELADLYISEYAKGPDFVRWEEAGSPDPWISEAGRKTAIPAPRKRSWKKDEAALKLHVRPKWGTRRANDITRRDVNDLLRKIAATSPIQANRVLEIVRKMYSWAIGGDVVDMDVNPCHEVKKPSKERARDRVLGDDEIRTLWPMAGEGAKITEASRLALRLILVTAQRPGEVVGLRWSELSPDWAEEERPLWTLPAERSKNGRAHEVPLSKQAVVILNQAKKLAGDSAFAFPSIRPGKPMRQSSLSHALGRSEYFGLEHFSPHDLRRSATTHMTGEGCGVSRFVVERVLNHTDRTVTGRHYDLYEYRSEKRAALTVWGSRLDAILAGEENSGGKVVKLHG